MIIHRSKERLKGGIMRSYIVQISEKRNSGFDAISGSIMKLDIQFYKCKESVFERINRFIDRSPSLFNRQLSTARAHYRKSRELLHGYNRSIKPEDDRGDVPGWVLVVLMTTGLVTAIWTIAAPRLSSILKNSLDAMNGIR
jgi:hypothetical protein